MEFVKWAFFVFCFLVISGRAEAAADRKNLIALSLEELMNMDVMSVSKTPEKQFEAPAAIYVITAEDIRRTGVTSIPEALRLVPGVQVARINSNQWSIGIRGFGTRLARYTLVLIDGRSVYDPLFAGTYWEVQDTLLEDIDRIEVVRGPGGALWGANAVNGVINIITKSAKDTHGSLLTLGGGSEERAFTGFRYGGHRENFHYRFYGKYFDRDESFATTGDDFDDWRMGQGGFRADVEMAESDTLTLQGDAYTGRLGELVGTGMYTAPFLKIEEEYGYVFGSNALARWSRRAGEHSSMALQFYYDHTHRQDPNFREKRDTEDVDFQQSFPLGRRHAFTYGAGYRATRDDTDGPTGIKAFKPTNRTLNLWNIFFQDQIVLVKDRLGFTIGSKAEHNDYTGWEYQPNGRLAWTPTHKQTIWGAVSRAVRTPSRVDRNPDIALAVAPPPPALIVARYTPNERFESETVMAYEWGYRIQPAGSFVAGVDGFYNHYDDLHSLNIKSAFPEPNPSKFVLPFIFENRMRGHIYGGEFNSVWNVVEGWRFEATYSHTRINIRRKEGSLDGVTENSVEGSSPRHQAVFRSSVDLPFSLEFDPALRYVSELPNGRIPAYWTADLHLGWHMNKNTEIAIVGQNLLQPRHAESGEGITEVQRGVYGKITWRM